MLHKESFYTKTRLLNLARRGGGRLKASRRMADMIIQFTRKSIRGDRPFVLTSIWAPSEILYALDIIPLNAESAAASLASFGLSDDFLDIAERNFHPPETCSILRCATGAVFDKLFPSPSAVVATTHLCDAGAKMISTASRVYGCEYFLIDVPHQDHDDAVLYVAEQLEEMATGLSEITGEKLKKERLARAITLSNEARSYALQSNALRRVVPSPMRGSEALSYLYLVGVGFGSEEALKVYKILAHELKRRVAKKFTPLGEEKYRLLWLHIKPYFRNRFFHYLEKERKAAIVFEEVNHIFWPELDPERPFESVARKLISNTANDPMDRHIGMLLHLAEEYSVDGVLHYAHWGCRWNYGRIRMVKEAFQDKGIPIISIECDSVSERNFFEDQLIRQIDSFLDMIG